MTDAQRPKSFKPQFGLATSNKFNGRAHIDAMYDDTWKKYRAKFLEKNQKCYACGTKATVVDHLQAHKGDRVLFTKRDNHIPLCEKCHNYVTGKFDRGPIQKFVEKLQWLAKNRMQNEVTFKVKVLPKYP